MKREQFPREIALPQEHQAFCSKIVKEEQVQEWSTKKLIFRNLEEKEELLEEGKKQKFSSSKHKKITQRTNAEKFNRTINYIKDPISGIVYPCTVRDRFLTINYRMHPEALPFLFYVDGCSKNLLLYLIFFKVDLYKNTYLWNSQIQDHFIEYSKAHHKKKYSLNTVKQAHEQLKKFNVILTTKRNNCILNPYLASCTSRDKRRQLVNDYTKILLEKGKDAYLSVYPKYLA